MTPRVTAILVGFVILLLGAAGLLYPERMLGLLGFAVQNPSHAAAALGEVRATYGGLFLVMGLAALLRLASAEEVEMLRAGLHTVRAGIRRRTPGQR